MKKYIYIVFLIFVFVTSIFPEDIDTLFEEKRVSVIPLWYESDILFAEELSTTIQSSIQWMIRMIEGYELVVSESYPVTQHDILTFSSKNDIDLLIYGIVDVTDDIYSVSLLLYNSNSDLVQEVEKGSVSNIMDTFDLSDALSIKIIESFLGRKLEFSRIVFNNINPRDADMECFINDSYVGENLSNLSPFLIGNYRLRIDQIENGDRFVIYDEIISVENNQPTIIDYSMVPFGFINIKESGPNIPTKILLDGKDIGWNHERKYPIPEGQYLLEVVEEPFEDGEYYTILSEQIEVVHGESIDIEIEKVGISHGFILSGNIESDYSVEVDSIDYGNNIHETGMIPTGYHTVNIFQIDLDGDKLIYSEGIWLGKRSQEIKFKMIEPDKNRYVLDATNTNISFESQALGGTTACGGIHFDLFDRQLGLSAMAAITVTSDYQIGAVFNFLFVGKAYWSPWPRARLSPYIGGVMIMGSSQSNFMFQMGPMLGITLNLNNRVFSSIYVEFQSHMWVGYGYQLANQVGFGFRLF